MKFIIGFMRTLCQDEHQYLAATPETELQLPPPFFIDAQQTGKYTLKQTACLRKTGCRVGDQNDQL